MAGAPRHSTRQVTVMRTVKDAGNVYNCEFNKGKEESYVEDLIITTWTLNATFLSSTVFTLDKTSIQAARKSQPCNSSYSLAGL